MGLGTALTLKERTMNETDKLCESLERKRSLGEVLAGTCWLQLDAIDPGQREAWKRDGRMFSVVHEGVELFPAYQFIDVGGRYQPRAVILSVLEAWGAIHDSWAVAAWFYFPNAWLIDRAGSSARNLSPVEALAMGLDDQVVQAAKRRHGSYVA